MVLSAFAGIKMAPIGDRLPILRYVLAAHGAIIISSVIGSKNRYGNESAYSMRDSSLADPLQAIYIIPPVGFDVRLHRGFYPILPRKNVVFPLSYIIALPVTGSMSSDKNVCLMFVPVI